MMRVLGSTKAAWPAVLTGMKLSPRHPQIVVRAKGSDAKTEQITGLVFKPMEEVNIEKAVYHSRAQMIDKQMSMST